MAIIERTVRVLEGLSKGKDPARPLQIAQALQLQPIHVGKELVESAKAGYAVKKDKEKNTWAITDDGKAYLKSLPPKGTTLPDTGTPTQAPSSGAPAQPVASTPQSVASTQETPPAPGTVTIPSQADPFRSEGELLGVGTRKGDIQLEAIVKYIERVADLNDLDSVWNALTEMGVADNIKKK